MTSDTPRNGKRLWWTARDLQERYRVSARTVQRWSSAGIFGRPYQFTGTRGTRWRIEDIAALDARLLTPERRGTC